MTRTRTENGACRVAATAGALIVAGGLLVGCGAVTPGPDTAARPPGATSSSARAPERFVEEALAVFEQGITADGPAWEAAKKNATAVGRSASTVAETYPALQAAIRVAGTRHSRLFGPNEGESLRGKSTGEYVAPTVRTAGGVTTVTVPGLGSTDPRRMQTFTDALGSGIASHSAATTCGYIVDLRGNDGGNMYPMIAGVSSLLPDGPVVGFAPRSGPAFNLRVDGNAVVGHAGPVARHGHGGGKITAPVAVLHDATTASSGEATLLAFAGRPLTRTFGRPTFGVPTANQPLHLSNGSIANLTIARDVDRTGAVHDSPIPPQQATAPADAPAAARAWLASRCGR